MLRLSKVSPHSCQPAKCFQRIDTASQTPLQKLCNINPTRRALGFEDPALTLPDLRGKLPLRQSGLVSQLDEQRRHFSVDDRKLTLGHERRSFPQVVVE